MKYNCYCYCFINVVIIIITVIVIDIIIIIIIIFVMIIVIYSGIVPKDLIFTKSLIFFQKAITNTERSWSC